LAQSSFEVKEISRSLPIFTTHLPDDGILKSIISNHRERFPNSTESNVKAWHSDWDTHKINPQFQYFVDLVESACTFLCHEHFKVGKEVRMKCENMWAMEYKEGDYAEEHDHFPSVLSCAYFVDVEDNSSPLIIEGLEIKPENGLLVIFPGLLRHKVDPTHGPRTVISMNFRSN